MGLNLLNKQVLCRSVCPSVLCMIEQSDQFLVCSLPIEKTTSSFKVLNLKPLASFGSKLDVCESSLDKDMEDRFSHEEASPEFAYVKNKGPDQLHGNHTADQCFYLHRKYPSTF